MQSAIHSLIDPLPLWALFIIIAVFLYTLAKGADILVAEAVTLSVRWGVPTLLIGATIVSLGTTLPEMAVSVVAAIGGRSGLALGNAVGSIICDTGLIMGIACLMRPIPIDKRIVNRQGYLQLAAGFLLVIMCVPWSTPGTLFQEGGRLPQWAGFLFLGLLVLYIYKSIGWARKGEVSEEEVSEDTEAQTVSVVLKLIIGMALVILSSKILIPTVEETAYRLNVPEAIIAATLVAFGTSLPELITVVTSVRRGHAALALGNVIGADILNVLFVAGAAAAVTSGGLAAEPRFFQILFPGMLFILLVFRISLWVCKTHLHRATGFILLGSYLLITVLSYLK